GGPHDPSVREPAVCAAPGWLVSPRHAADQARAAVPQGHARRTADRRWPRRALDARMSAEPIPVLTGNPAARSPWRDVWRRFVTDRRAMVGLAFLVSMLLGALLA